MFWEKGKKRLITCSGREDGAGAQISAAVSTILYARHFGYDYVHTPLTNVAHFQDGQDPKKWAADWERFFSLGDGEPPAKLHDSLEQHYLRRPHRWRPKAGKLNFVHHCHKVTDRQAELWSAYRPELRRKFTVHPKPPTSTCPEGVRKIGVHIRRGDVRSDNQFTSRFTPNRRILEVLSRITKALGNESYEVHIYSQSGSDLSDFDAIEPVWHLDEDPFVTFNSLVNCDILLPAISSFSWLAGLISTGRVVQDEFWHPPMPDWITFGDTDQLSRSALADHLKQPNRSTVPA